MWMFNNFHLKLGNAYAFKIPDSYHLINLLEDIYIKGLQYGLKKKKEKIKKTKTQLQYAFDLLNLMVRPSFLKAFSE